MLGFSHDTKLEYCLDDIMANRKMELFPPTIGSAYVYCDSAEHVPVGDTKAPLLRIVNRMTYRGNNNNNNNNNSQTISNAP